MRSSASNVRTSTTIDTVHATMSHYRPGRRGLIIPALQRLIMTAFCHEIVISTVELASPATITTRDIIMNTSYMQRAGRKLVDAIDCSGTAMHSVLRRATLASTGRHRHGRSIQAFRTTLPTYERYSIHRQSLQEAMASRCFWWHQSASWSCSNSVEARTDFVLLRRYPSTQL